MDRSREGGEGGPRVMVEEQVMGGRGGGEGDPVHTGRRGKGGEGRGGEGDPVHRGKAGREEGGWKWGQGGQMRCFLACFARPHPALYQRPRSPFQPITTCNPTQLYPCSPSPCCPSHNYLAIPLLTDIYPALHLTPPPSLPTLLPLSQMPCHSHLGCHLL